MTVSIVALELMSTSQPPAKRKASEDPNPLNAAPKRTRKDNVASTKRKLVNGEEQPSGLVILRSAPSRPPSALGNKPPSSSQQPQASTSRAPSLQPPAKKFKSSSTSVDQPHASTSQDRSARQPSHVDAQMPLAPRETPQIEKNKQMRGEGSNGHSRRSSVSMRGKRMSTSFENTGVIVQPHSSVEEKAFHMHIDRDLPESSRARQLLIWCAARTEADAGPSRKPRDQLPPLDANGARLVKDLRDAAIRMLAEGRIDTNVMSPAGSDAGSRKLAPHQDNERNRAKKAQFTADIERAQAEDNAWAEVEQYYKSRDAMVMSDLEQRRKAKGKQRALGPDDWGPRDEELPERFHAGVKLARSVLASAGPSSQEKSPLDKRWSDVQYTIDELHTLVNTATQTASVATTDLDHRFALISLTLAAHAQAHPHPHHPPAASSASAALSAYLPPRTHEPDPQELFRALSRVDMARPPAQRGDAAFRALREVQRAQAQGGAEGERRLTGVPPPTPRKPPGTPRRAGTPGKR
ncbi:hypothetical protein FA95DRAFT_1553684 [Auriscalpium vulgare]|uniref:Uncharacterized protein n=1 Tax=Auriscalpium vulgare TaxID=40419 RepID=A0ACB8S6X8_9AGAM|nr:hypothetical protein FA95DRAFT_1553684 [Auriscalpium vulgare]